MLLFPIILALLLFLNLVGISLNDLLLFRSDLTAFAHGLFVAVLPVAIVLSIMARLWKRLARVLDSVLTTLIIGLLISVTFLLVLHSFGREPASSIESLLLSLAILVLVWRVELRLSPSTRRELRQRLALLSLLLTLCMGGYALGSLTLSHVRPRLASGVQNAASRGVVLIVVDALRADILDPGSRAFAGDSHSRSLIERGEIFRNVITNRPYTWGFFGTLYSGRRNFEAGLRSHNLLSELQRNGVIARWDVIHQNALPDATGLTYDGFRSKFLSENLSPLFRLARVPYHVFRHRPGRRTGTAERLVEGALNGFGGARPFPKHLEAEVESLLGESRPFFLAFHTFYHAEDSVKVEGEHAGLSAYFEASGEQSSEQARRIHASEYVYERNDDEFVRSYRDYYMEGARLGLKQLSAFVDTFYRRGWDSRVTLIVTADHGSAFSDGRIWYGYHPQADVMRVPFILFERGRSGFNDTAVETVDISATILRQLGIPPPPEFEGRSILAPEKQRVLGGLTLPSHSRREQFLIGVRGESWDLFNVYPGNEGYVRSICFSEECQTSAATQPRSISESELETLKASFGIDN